MSKRDDLRAKSLSSSIFRKEIVVHEGNEYEIRQTSYQGRDELFKKCQSEDGKPSTLAVIWATIYCTFVPGTDELVFEEGDYKTLASQPAGGLVDKLGKVALELLNVAEDNIEKK